MAFVYVPYTGAVVTRAEARAAGEKWFFTALPCKRAGHLSQRLVSNGNCGACHWTSMLAYRERNRAAINARQQEKRAEIPEKLAEWRARTYLKNRDRRVAECRVWRENNPLKVRALGQNRRARVRAAEGSHTAEEIEHLFSRQRGRCAYCRKSIRDGFHADHIVPLAKGGSNWISNIQLTCSLCNRRKHATDPIEFAQRLGRLL